MKLSNAEKLAKKVLTAKSHKTATKYMNQINSMTNEQQHECLTLISRHGNKNLIGHGAIYPNSYLIGGDFK